MRATTALAVALSAFSCLSVEDATPSPPVYRADAPQGFPIKGKVEITAGMSDPSLTTVMLLGTPSTFQWTQAIPMTRSTTDPTVYDGVFNPNYLGARPFIACGFKVQHTARANLLGFIPQSKVATKDVAGNSYAEYVAIGNASGAAFTATFPSGGNGTIKTGPFVVYTFSSEWDVSLLNYYRSGLTVTNASLTCGNGQACDSFNPIYVGAISTPSLPVTLACTDFTHVSFQCTDEAINSGRGGEVRFDTNKGTVIVPFVCGPVMGA